MQQQEGLHAERSIVFDCLERAARCRRIRTSRESAGRTRSARGTNHYCPYCASAGSRRDCLGPRKRGTAGAARKSNDSAYCDPSNEIRGSKYDATKGLSRVEIAARIRADIKVAFKSGAIPAGVKLSVKTRSYSGGGSIDISITALPDSFRLTSPRFAAWAKNNPNEYRHGLPPFNVSERQSDEYNALLAALKSIHSAYNRDNSDGMTDYFDRRYYGDVSIDWQLSNTMRKAEGLPE